MTNPTEFLIHITGLLEGLGIPYHVGGSFDPFARESATRLAV